jgi:uncharacterized protein YjbJ (UPF0337 family)
MNYSLLALISILLFTAGCDNKEGNAEKAGAAIDDTIEKVQEKASEMVESFDNDGPMENAGEAVDTAVKNAKASTQAAMDSAKESSSEAMTQVREASQEAMDDARASADEYSEKLKQQAAEAKRKTQQALNKQND